MDDLRCNPRVGLAVLGILVGTWGTTPASGTETVLLPRCQPVTLETGEISGRGDSTAGFLGEDRVIRDAPTWAAFWREHAGIHDPAPLPPQVDFRRHTVIAVVQGHQPSGGGPSITISGLLHEFPDDPGTAAPPGSFLVEVVDDERPGDLPVITNPYHFALVPRRCVPDRAGVAFRHLAPIPGSGVIRGHVWVPADAVDWRAAPGVEVLLHSTDGTAPQISVTGRDGSYSFLGLPPGDYLVRVDVPPYLPESRQLAVTEDAILSWEFFLVPGP